MQDGIRNDELSDAALSDVNRLRPDGTTGIGGGMLTGAAEIGGPDPDRAKVMVVLTDGKENVAPFIAEAVADLQANSSHIQTYSVGLGFDIEPTKLQSITNMGTEGYHQVVSTLRDETLFDLETFYFKIFSSAADLDLVTDPTHIINLASGNPVVVDHARVISSDRSATFLILDDPMMRTLYDLEFIAPDGTVLPGGVNGRRHSDPRADPQHLPDLPDHLPGSRTGRHLCRGLVAKARAKGQLDGGARAQPRRRVPHGLRRLHASGERGGPDRLRGSSRLRLPSGGERHRDVLPARRDAAASRPR